MRTEQVTIEISAERKAVFAARAARRAITTGEYLRRAVDELPDDEESEAELAALLADAKTAIPKLAASLERVSARLEQIHRDNEDFFRSMGARG